MPAAERLPAPTWFWVVAAIAAAFGVLVYVLWTWQRLEIFKMLLASFFLTVIVDLTVAIGVGMVLASFLFMHRMSEVTNVSAMTREFRREVRGEGEEERDEVGLR